MAIFDYHCHIRTSDAYFCDHEIMIDRRFVKEKSLQQQADEALFVLSCEQKEGKLSTLHCVRAPFYMLDILRKVPLNKGKVLWHGFHGSVETARELYRLGVIISIGPTFKGDLLAITQADPYFVLESDYTGSDEAEQKTIIREHYENCAQKLGLALEELVKRCDENAVAFKT